MGIVGIFIFIIGLCLGSFINVVIYRLPQKQSIVFPGSCCPKCKVKISWFDNLPLISWVLLRGNCRNCKTKISVSYPIIELTVGFFVWRNIYSNPSIYSDISQNLIILLGTILSCFLITLAILDIKYFWLPKILTLGGLLIGLTSSFLIDLFDDIDKFGYSINSFFGALLGFLFFYLLSILGQKIYKKPVLGNGDAKLSALIGSWLGIKGLFISIWLSFFTAGIFVFLGIILKKIKRNQKIPFGLFLSFSCLLVWNFGNDLFLKIIFRN